MNICTYTFFIVQLVLFVDTCASDNSYPKFLQERHAKHGIAESCDSEKDLLGNGFLQKESATKRLLLSYVGKRVLIVHGTYSRKSLHKILKNGLCSKKRFLQEADIESLRDFYKAWHVSDEELEKVRCAEIDFAEKLVERNVFDLVQTFFAPSRSYLGRFGNVGMLVDPEKTYVYNMLCKDPCDLNRYKASRVLLSEYLKNVKIAEAMKKAAQNNEEVYLDGLTSEPRYKKKEEYAFLYVAEVPYNIDHIAPNQLFMVKDENFTVRDIIFRNMDDFNKDCTL
ncbi:MAG: hypothetical protein CL947_04785 [Epsilonproteobacteria bacterium]|nr:hypothetical protein [Campylobacterota bacterium]